ncbi:MAG: hypothetical protein U9Q82_07010 [Chloroflexota bacterium]|nr:hypothetical protein [Chloroflexota bacterium]
MQKTQPQRNPKTQASHKKDIFWQITIPLIFGALAILGLAIWSVVAAAKGGDVGPAADAALIFMVIPTMLMALIPLALLGGCVYLSTRLLKILPPQIYRLQNFFLRLQAGVQKGADKAVEPILRSKSWAAAWRILIQHCGGKKQNK